jgi:hypothetical protein
MMSGPERTRSRFRRRRWVSVTVAVGVGLAVLLVLGLNDSFLVLSSGPDTIYFSGHMTTPTPCEGGTDCTYFDVPNQSLPARTNVSFHWTDQTGGSVSLWASGPGPHDSTVNQCWWSNNTRGACSFTLLGRVYSFYASNVYISEGPQVVNYTGSYLS